MVGNAITDYAADANEDTDGDGLTNLQEYQLGADPNDSDTDNDNMPDGWEFDNNLNATDASDANEDTDDDGLTNLQEYQLGADPNDSDTDNDQMPDGWEYNNGLNAASEDTDDDGLTNLQEYQLGADPTDSDTDGDGMPDGWEYNNGLNATDATDASEDTDDDGLTNLQEYQLDTNPNDSDTDNDGMPDGWEYNNGYNPLNSAVSPAEYIHYNIIWFLAIFIGIIVSSAYVARSIRKKKKIGKQVMQVTPVSIEAETTTVTIPGYKIKNILGSGSFGTVFKAVDPQGREVALKILSSFDSSTEKAFIREISIWKTLDHPNIVKLLSFDIKPIPHIVMELMDNTLRDVLRNKGRLSEKETLEIILDIAQALQYAHKEFYIVHRDVKPENILSKGGIYKLSDWGLAGIQTQISASGFKGTIAYSAPEQFDPSVGNISQWTDVWQLGAVMYELVAGEPPFGKDVAIVVKKVLHEELKRPEGITDNLWELIQDMLKKKPEERIPMHKVISKIRAMQTQQD